jgi:uncharacterized protein (TIGR00369 family)
MSSLQVPPNCDLTLGMICLDKAEPGRTVWQMTADERFANTAGICQGGFLGAFADSAMGASAVTYARARAADAGGSTAGVLVANAEMKMSFIRAVQIGSILSCEAVVISGGERVAFCEATITGETGKIVGRASSTYVISTRP